MPDPGSARGVTLVSMEGEHDTMTTDLRFCRALLTLSADIRPALRESCPRCQGAGEACLVALMTAVLAAAEEGADAPESAPPPANALI